MADTQNTLPAALGNKEENQSEYRGIPRGAGGKEYAKWAVG